MNSITWLRQNLDISQELLASFCLTSRSVIAHAEGERSILRHPAIMHYTMIQMELLRLEITPAPVADAAAQEAARQQMFATTIEHCSIKIKRAQRRLAMLQQKATVAYKAIAVAEALLAGGLAAGDDGQQQELCVKIMMSEARQRLRSCGIAAQQKLQLQIATLEFTKAEAERMKEHILV